MKSKRHIFLLIIHLFALLVISGCSKDSPESIETSAATESTTAAVTTVTVAETTVTIAETTPAATETTQAETTNAPAVTTTAPPVIVRETATTTTTQPEILSAPYEGLYEADSLHGIHEKSADKRIAPASLTKLVTACTALKYVSADTVFTVGTEQTLVPAHSSLCLIEQGHRLKLGDLVAGMLMKSGNDAAYTVAVNVARTVSKDASMTDKEAVTFFVKLMNEYAAEIGAKQSHFVHPDGWDHAEQHTTVRDLALISSRAMEKPAIREVASVQSKRVKFASGENITWSNTNQLINSSSKYYCKYAIGLKTGTTALAGKCLISVLKMNGKEYIAIVAGCQTDSERYEAALKLIDRL